MEEYRDVTIKICSGYEIGKGMDELEMKSFEKEIKEIFGGLGFDVRRKNESSSLYAKKGLSELYLHPMAISGPLEINLLKEVEKTIGSASTFEIKEVNIGEKLAPYTYDQEMDYYKNKYDSRIFKILKRHFSTRKKEHFVNRYDVEFSLADELEVKTFENRLGRSCYDAIMIYLKQRIDSMIQCGELIQGREPYNLRSK